MEDDFNGLKEQFDPSYAKELAKNIEHDLSFSDYPIDAQLSCVVGLLLFPITIPAFGVYSLVNYIKDTTKQKRYQKRENEIIQKEFEEANEAGYPTTLEEITQSRKTLSFPSKERSWIDIKGVLELLWIEPERVNGYTAWKTSQVYKQNIPHVDTVAETVLSIYNKSQYKKNIEEFNKKSDERLIEEILKQNPNLISITNTGNIDVKTKFCLIKTPSLLRKQKAPPQDPKQKDVDYNFEALTGIKPKLESRYFPYEGEGVEVGVGCVEVNIRRFSDLGEAVKYGNFLKKVIKKSYNKK